MCLKNHCRWIYKTNASRNGFLQVQRYLKSPFRWHIHISQVTRVVFHEMNPVAGDLSTTFVQCEDSRARWNAILCNDSILAKSLHSLIYHYYFRTDEARPSWPTRLDVFFVRDRWGRTKFIYYSLTPTRRRKSFFVLTDEAGHPLRSWPTRPNARTHKELLAKFRVSYIIASSHSATPFLGIIYFMQCTFMEYRTSLLWRPYDKSLIGGFL